MSAPPALTPDQFGKFFEALWGYTPFPWQEEFARRLCVGEAPDYVTVPTGSGKTACLDAAVFALAVQSFLPVERRTVGRRIFFIVNRRIIVDEAFDRASRHLVSALANPAGYIREREENKEKPEERLSSQEQDAAILVLKRIADALRDIGGETPLACAELRGGIYRDRAWAKSIVQPMILCGTVDQVGSRLLFRGYGVSDEARPIHAALVAQDSLLIIDEAHISQPFLQTLDWVKRYRTHRSAGAETVALPFSVVRLTATPLQGGDVTKLELSDKDREHTTLRRRLGAEKKVSLVTAPKAKGKSVLPELAKALEQEASGIIAQNPALRSIAVMVNRVATARAVEELLRRKHGGEKTRITLVIGRMRPIDRDEVTRQLQEALKTGRRVDSDRLEIVVSTQCLEVGADLDFDAVVSECASLDALRQRFGRLNRDGKISATGVIVMPEEQRVEEAKLDDEKPIDPVYGNAVPRTWRWLEANSTDRVIDFGLTVMTEAVRAAREADEEAFQRMLMPRADAPIMLPAYLDCWAQTNPAPAADPDVALFFHGPQRDMAEVQVCWRADLPEDETLWAETIGLCAPTTLECLPVPLHLMRQWLEKGDAVEDTGGDAPALTPPEEDTRKKKSFPLVRVMIWNRAGDGVLVNSPKDIRPGQTLILRVQDGGWESLGHVPKESIALPYGGIDQAEDGVAQIRRLAMVRLHPRIYWPGGEEDTFGGKLRKWAGDRETDWRSEEVIAALSSMAESVSQDIELPKRLRHLIKNSRKLLAEWYPDGSGVVLSVREPFLPDSKDEPGSPEDGPDDPLLDMGRRQTLEAHTAQVVQLTERYVEHIGLGRFGKAFTSASRLHDIGKADPRFQALLIQGTLGAAYAQPVLWAKSDNIPDSRAGRERARLRAELPKRFRHEMTSMLMATFPGAGGSLPEDGPERELALHLIASHHGHARPLAPIVHDEDPPPIEYSDTGCSVQLGMEHRLASPAHAIDSGITERFWRLTRLHGWWGLAVLEAVLRLADQTASAHPETVSDK